MRMEAAEAADIGRLEFKAEFSRLTTAPLIITRYRRWGKRFTVINGGAHYFGRWPSGDKGILRKNWMQLKAKEIQPLLSGDYSVRAIYRMADRLGLPRKRNRKRKPIRRVRDEAGI